MGYDVHITRRDHWSDEDNDIELNEWSAYIQSDQDMRLDGYAETETPDGVLRIESDGLAVWTGYSKHEEDGNMAWFSYFEGDVCVKYPDEEVLQKMHRISVSLGAKVQGDDGELYDESGIPERASANIQTKKWWQFWK